jgi:hypothetical protein
MAVEADNLVLELLRQIRSEMAELRFDVTDMKARVSSIEQFQGNILTMLGGISQPMDRSDEKISRIERRLDLVDHH